METEQTELTFRQTLEQKATELKYEILNAMRAKTNMYQIYCQISVKRSAILVLLNEKPRLSDGELMIRYFQMLDDLPF